MAIEESSKVVIHNPLVKDIDDPYIILQERFLKRDPSRLTRNLTNYFSDIISGAPQSAAVGVDFGGKIVKNLVSRWTDPQNESQGDSTEVSSAAKAEKQAEILRQKQTAKANAEKNVSNLGVFSAIMEDEISQYISDLEDLYPYDPKVGSTYNLPILDEVAYGFSQSYKTSNISSMVTGMVNLGIINEISNMLPINTELGKSWDSQSSRTIPITINLVNTDDDVIRDNLLLIDKLNMANRFEQAGPYRFPPSVYNVDIPGFYYHPWMAVTSMEVKTTGTFFKTNTNLNVPQGYQIKLVLEELVPITSSVYKKYVFDKRPKNPIITTPGLPDGGGDEYAAYSYATRGFRGIE